jgi:2-C-methyl-D-erythritol 2,4-cyclodiphosphate synthase
MSVSLRVGIGYDSHRFEDGRRLVLGGVEFPGETGLKGHSDADVLIHAVIDALLGAAALGDIGSHFSDTDEKWRGADSAALLEATVAELAGSGCAVVNIDAVVICERPRLAGRIEDIRRRMAELTGLDVADVGIKGKTNEKMDATGAGIGIAVHAVALVERGK